MSHTTSSVLEELKLFSAEIGRDPLLIQGAGGNTSVKDGADMWIKASGTQLQNAEDVGAFVSVDHIGIAQAVRNDPGKADQPSLFQRGGKQRPSIETCLHAILDQPVVVHVHCVDTIALAMRTDARELFAEKLNGIDFGFVDYHKPGARLAQAIAQVIEPRRDVYILGNHGLLIGAPSIAQARHLLSRIVKRLRTWPSQNCDVPHEKLGMRLPRNYSFTPVDHPLHHISLADSVRALATSGGLFPDQVLFCGPNLIVVDPTEDVMSQIKQQADARLGDPVLFFIAGIGAAIKKDASDTEHAMARCVGDVLARVPETAQLNYISRSECNALLDWDAEKYRHSMNT